MTIPLPWKLNYYDINTDNHAYSWQQLVIACEIKYRCIYFKCGLRWWPIKPVVCQS